MGLHPWTLPLSGSKCHKCFIFLRIFTICEIDFKSRVTHASFKTFFDRLRRNKRGKTIFRVQFICIDTTDRRRHIRLHCVGG